ncbi:probable glycosyltransferase STELLO1 [Dendrobium catenatum]|uniref:Glycosyltransferase STELLO1 n=1 Tax=Dendrobium catenatum TaxID=906689 RepID=A0A2I0VNN4_9ASPA|nr:probable glycosyltransferase STELLO1 [Dendrobium catenatum]PKU65025.1 hypothetical protein MA16_Dca004640 [Dendrobium catenatum]
MQIQERGTADGAANISKPFPRPLTYLDSPIRGKKSRDLSFASSPSSCNTYKLFALFILIASIAALFFLRGTSDGAALLCLDNRPARSLPATITYPDISWSTVPAIHAVDPAAVAPFASFRSERWIVVSVSAPPTDSLRLLVKTRGWQLLAVGNSHTPVDWSLKGAIFLSLDLQSRLGFRTVDFLPYASYVRKSIGYLFAIQHGAKIIYDADDRSDILGGDLSKHFDLDLGAAAGAASGYPVLLQYSRTADNNRTIVNPYVHFGQRSVWPRGLPLESVKEVSHEEFYSEIRGGGQFIQQGLSNGLPDVDSIFYFTRKSSRSEPYDILFDEDAPKVALPQGLMVPVNSFNTIFHSQAFWSLMLPVSVSSMASDVIRGYFAQRIMWEIGGYVAVYPPTIHRQDKAEAYPFSEEKDLHVNVARLIKFLVSWRSAKPTIFDRILDLSYAMANEGFWAEKDMLLTAAWLQDLISIGYQQPRMISPELNQVKEASRLGDRREFVPRKISSIHLGVDESGSVNYEIGNLIRWRRSFGNVVLIMHCSGPVERTALEWRLLYGRIFKTVVILSEHNSTDLAVEYGELSIVYKHLPRVFAQFDNAEGFLFLQDSMVLNYWNLLQADKARLWITNKVPQSWVSVSIDSKSSKWFVEQAAMVKKVVDTLPVHLQVSYKEGTNEDKLIICSSEVFYVPRHFVNDFVDLVGLVGDLNIHHKVAVPLFFLAMDSQQNFDSDALARIVYQTTLPSNGSSFSYYTAKASAVYPLKVLNEPDFVKLVQVMASGDPLLMELV